MTRIALFTFIVFPILALGFTLIWSGIKIKRHNAQDHDVERPVRNCIVCKIGTLKRKAVAMVGRSIGRMRMNTRCFGKPVRPDYELPIYQQSGVLTAHGRKFRRRSKRPDLQFLAIPYDIRHMVYLLLLASVVSVDCMPTWVLKPNRQFLTLTSLFRACRQTRDEFAPVFYRKILFSIYLEYPFHRLYRELCLPAIHGLREIHLTINTRVLTETCWQTLRGATNVRELYFTFKHINTYFAYRGALDLLLDESQSNTRLNLRLFQVMVHSNIFLPSTNVHFVHEVLFAANGHWHATRNWGTPTIVQTHLKRVDRGRPRFMSIPRFCIRVHQKGYESSLSRRCEDLAVDNPMWEFPKVPSERLLPQNIWF